LLPHERGEWLFRGLKRYDTLTRRTQTLEYGRRCWGSEPQMARRIGAVDEDDGYVVTFVNNLEDERSECWVIPAQDISRGPLARIVLPHRISAGTHAAWVEADRIRGEHRDPRYVPAG
jgi:carotenoid cleavage dioxygenase-like enzyme